MALVRRLMTFLVSLKAVIVPITAARHGLKGAQYLGHNVWRGEVRPSQKIEGVFSMVMHKWQAFPDDESFADSCAEGLKKLLPELGKEYTAEQVPHALHSECDVWVTKKGYVADGSSLDAAEYTGKSSPLGRLASKGSQLGWSEAEETLSTARVSCEQCADLLGEEFLHGKQDYKGWCKNITGVLQKMEQLPQLRTDIANLWRQHEVLKDEYEKMRFKQHEGKHEVKQIGKEKSFWKRWAVRKSSGSRSLLSLLALSLAFLMQY